MTHLILQTDIELAQRLIAGRHPDEDIVAALVRRGIDPEKAAALVQDLQQGKPVAPEIEINYEQGFKREPEPGQPEGAPQRSRPRSSSRSQRQKKRGSQGRWIWVVLLLVLLGSVAVYYGMNQAGKHGESSLPPVNTSIQDSIGETSPPTAMSAPETVPPPVQPAPSPK